MYTKQQTFNIVRRHLMSMDEPAVDEDCNCCYRNGDGDRCAIGILIPDDLYDPSMEGISLSDPFPNDQKKMIEFIQLLGHDVELCTDLQDVHDGRFSFKANTFDNKAELEYFLFCVAVKHGLRMPA